MVKLDVFLGAMDHSIITKWKKHATIHTETAQLNKKGNCQRSDQAARTLWMKWKKLWMSGQSLSASQICPLCVSGYKKATIEEGQHEVTQFTRRHDSTF